MSTAMPGQAAARMAAHGIVLPAPMKAVASYVPYTIVRHGLGHLVHVAGQGPFENGQLRYIGKLGDTLSVNDGQASAHLVALNVLAQAADAVRSIHGRIDLDRLRCLRLGCFVQCTDGFREIDAVLAPGSQLMLDVLGDAGVHARLAVGKPCLPMGTSVEIDGMFEIR